MSGTREVGHAEKSHGLRISVWVRGIDSALLHDAILRLYTLQDIASIRVILVHAISGAAKRFYKNPASSPLRSTR